MRPPLVEITDLSVGYRTAHGFVRAVRGVSLIIASGDIIGIVGESGCGKTTLAYSLFDDLGTNARSSGKVVLDGHDVLSPATSLRDVRGSLVAMVQQNPGEALNPARRVGDQLREVLAVHKGLRGALANSRIAELLKKVHLHEPETIMRRWPHELSGGQQQRVVIAMALLAEPKLLVLDEPTTGLDVTVEAAVLDLLAELRSSFGITIVLISHNLAAISRACDRVVVLYAGLVAESGRSTDIFNQPRHPYTRALLDCIPRVDRTKAEQPPTPIPGSVPSPLEVLKGCAFAGRCGFVVPACRDAQPSLIQCGTDRSVACLRADDIAMHEAARPLPVEELPKPEPREVVLSVEHLSVVYKGARNREPLKALDDVNFTLHAGRITAIVGESGSGKSTLAGAIAGLRIITGGAVYLDSNAVNARLARRPHWALRFLQMVFQDHGSTLNPELRSGLSLERAIRLLDRTGSKDVHRRLAEIFRDVDLDPKLALRRPSQLSGGQRQRMAIARAFAGRPDVVICDEITSALDVSVQSQVISFLQKLQRTSGTSLIFITHDLGIVRQIADYIIVMHRGKICEQGDSETIFQYPRHTYTKHLLASAARGIENLKSDRNEDLASSSS